MDQKHDKKKLALLLREQQRRIKDKTIISCVCLTCGVRNDHSTHNGYCRNGHDDWLEYRDVMLLEDADKLPLLRAMKLFALSEPELIKRFINPRIKNFKIIQS